MINLLFSILCSTALLMIFKSLELFKIDLFLVIIINYITASFLGMLLFRKGFQAYYLKMHQHEWFLLSIFIGVLLIIMFFLIGISTQKAGVSVTSVSTRMSVVIPMFFSMWHYQETINTIKVSGMVLAVISLALTAVKKKESATPLRYVYLPVLLFLGSGLLDAIVKYAQQDLVRPEHSALFTGASFTWAFIVGIIACFVKKVSVKSFFNQRVLCAGILLGIFNFGTIFFLINALNSDLFDSSILFGINSIGIVGLSILLAIIVFKEKLLAVNWAGVGFAALAIAALVYS